MWFSSWLRSGSSSRPARRQRRQRSSEARFRPRVETLEGRALLSTLTVLNNLDSGPDSLRAGIALAHSGDIIFFSPDLSGQTITLNSGELLINKSLTIRGESTDGLTISGGFQSRVFEIQGAKTNVTISGLTIRDGNGVGTDGFTNSSLGGGIYNASALTISSCTIVGNSVDSIIAAQNVHFGGAIYNAGTLTVSNSILSGNAAGDSGAGGPDGLASGYPGNGGAIYNAYHATATITGSTLTNNVAYGSGFYGGNGGAIYNVGSLSVGNSTLLDNGAIDNFFDLPGHAGGVGGGIYNGYKAILTITSTTLSGNSATELGGGIYSDGTVALSQTTVTANSAGGEGGGIFNDRHGRLTIQSSLVDGNTAFRGADIYNLGSVRISKSTIGVIGP